MFQLVNVVARFRVLCLALASTYTELMAVTSSNLNRFSKKITYRFSRKCAIKRSLKILPHLIHVATLPCKTQCLKTSDILKLMSWSPINHTVVQPHIWGVVKFPIVIFYKFITQSGSEENFLNRWTFDRIAGKDVDCMLMMVSKSSFLWRCWRRCE